MQPPPKNSKKLYKLITELSGENKLNLLPDSTSNEEFAEEFTNYFLEKILKIGKLFDGIPNYTPNSKEVPQLNKLSTLTESQLYYRKIMEMASKTCELDWIPKEFLKKVLGHCIPAMTKIVNFIIKLRGLLWRMEDSHSKTSEKGNKKGNWKIQDRPVSNLQFIFKVIKNVHLTYLLIIAKNTTCYQNINLPVEAWYSLEQYIGLKEDKLSSTTVDFIRSEWNLETKHLYWFKKPKMC